MTAKLYEATQLDELLSLGGAELKNHFIADLQRCQTQLTESMTDAKRDQRQSLEQSRRILHELRGISLTIGAAPLVKLCAEAEAFCDMGSLQDTMVRQPEILNLCSALIDEISAHPTGLS